MMRRYNRLLVAFYVVTDALLGMAAFVVAYLLRFETGIANLIPSPRGSRRSSSTSTSCRSSGVLVPLGVPRAGPLPAAPRPHAGRRFLRRLRRQHPGRRPRADRHALLPGLSRAATPRRARASTRSRGRSGSSSSTVNVIVTYTSRELVREALERRWRAGIGLKRVLIAGSGDLGRLVADKLLEHRELGFKVVGFLDDRARRSHRLSRPAAPRHAGRRRRDHRGRSGSITSTSRCRSTST